MIELLNGRLAGVYGDRVVVDVGGVGYGVQVPAPELATSVDGEPVRLHVHTHVREDAIHLFGFSSLERREFFTLLLGVSGVGPKHALAMLSTCTALELAGAVLSEDATLFESVKGVGARLSKKIILELKPKIEKLGFASRLAAEAARAGASGGSKTSESSETTKARCLEREMVQDLRSALLHLGYKDRELQPVLKRIAEDPPTTDLANLIRAALGELGGIHGHGYQADTDPF